MQLLEALQSFVKFCALETYSLESFVEPYWLELRFLLAGISTESLTYCHNLYRSGKCCPVVGSPTHNATG